jgi:hypothetical protein
MEPCPPPVTCKIVLALWIPENGFAAKTVPPSTALGYEIVSCASVARVILAKAPLARALFCRFLFGNALPPYGKALPLTRRPWTFVACYAGLLRGHIDLSSCVELVNTVAICRLTRRRRQWRRGRR